MIPIPTPISESSEEYGASNAPFAVLFDSDGVIVDSEHISLIAFRQATEEALGAPLPEEEIEAACGLRDSDIVARLRRHFTVDVDLDAYSRRKGELYREQARENPVRPFPGVRELLENLREQRIPFALASSGPRWKICFNLQSAELTELFDVIVSGEDVERGKPEPDIFIEAARRVGVAPERCLVVEDSINGIRAARAAGMACLAITNTFHSYQLNQADRIVESLERLSVNDLARLVFDKHYRPHPPREAALPAQQAAVKTEIQTLN